MRKGQVKGLNGGAAQGQAKFVLSLFRHAAELEALNELSRLEMIFATLRNPSNILILKVINCLKIFLDHSCSRA